MTLHDAVLAVRKHWLWVLTPILVLTLGIGYLSERAEPVYRARTALFVALAIGDSASDLNQGSNYTQAQMLSFSQLASLPIVLDPVVEELDLPMSARGLAGRISATTANGTSIINIAVTGPSPDEAARIANAVAGQLTTVIAQVAPTTSEGQASIRATIVDEAVPPRYPSSPNVERNVIAAGLAGLILGLAAAYLRQAFDTRVRRPEDLDTATDVPLLGVVRSVRKAALETRVGDAVLSGPQAEEFRRLRTNLQMVGERGAPRMFALSSAVEGEGKTHTNLRLAFSFAAAGDRVLVIDADLRRPAVAERLGLEGAAGLTECLVGRAEFDDVVQHLGDGPSVLASGTVPPNPGELLASKEFAALLQHVAGQFDVVFVDTPPLLPVADAVVVSRQVAGLVLVVDASKARRPQIVRAVEAVHRGGGRVVGVVLNRSRTAQEESYVYGTRRGTRRWSRSGTRSRVKSGQTG